MNRIAHNLTIVRILALAFVTSGCSTVPKEVVELSYTLGQDIGAVRQIHIALIHDRFDRLRAQRLQYFDDVFKPKFIEGWIQSEHLVEIANGQLVWSKTEKKYVAPTAGQEKAQLLYTIQLWAKVALVKLDAKKKSLLDPIDSDEKAMIAQADEAFSRLERANATITAHLNSLRKVQEVQDEALKDLKVKDLRDKLDQMLIKTSESAQQGLDDIKKADGIINEAQDSADKLIKEIK